MWSGLLNTLIYSSSALGLLGFVVLRTTGLPAGGSGRGADCSVGKFCGLEEPLLEAELVL